MPLSYMTLTGDVELDQFLREAPDKLTKKVVRSALRPTAKPVAEKIRKDAPKEEGDYEKTIVVRALKRSRKHKHVVGVRIVTDLKKLAAISEQNGVIFNPFWLEYGTDDTPAQPHFRPAMDSSRKQVITDFRRHINPLVEELAREARTP